MQSLLYFLLWAGFFVLMKSFGCEVSGFIPRLSDLTGGPTHGRAGQS